MQLAVSPVPDIAPASRSNAPDGHADASHDASNHDFEKALSAAHTDRTEQRSSAHRADPSDKPKEHDHDDKDDPAAVPTAMQAPAIVGTPPASQQPSVSQAQDAGTHTTSMDGVAPAAPQSQGLNQSTAGTTELMSTPSGTAALGTPRPGNLSSQGSQGSLLAINAAPSAPADASQAVPDPNGSVQAPAAPVLTTAGPALSGAGGVQIPPAAALLAAATAPTPAVVATPASAAVVPSGPVAQLPGRALPAEDALVSTGITASTSDLALPAAVSSKPQGALALIRSAFAQVSVTVAATAQPGKAIGLPGKAAPASLQDVLQSANQVQASQDPLVAGLQPLAPASSLKQFSATAGNMHLAAAPMNRGTANSPAADLKNTVPIPDNLLGNAQVAGTLQATTFGLDDGPTDDGKKSDDVVVPGLAQANTAIASGAPAAKAESMKPIDQDAMVARVGQAIKQMSTNATNKNSSVSIHLNPVEWGKLNITVGLDGAQAGAGSTLKAHIVAETEAVKTALQQHLSELKGHLQADGIRVDNITVTVQAAASSSDAGTDSHRQDPSGGGGAPNPQQQSGFSGFGGGTFSQSFSGTGYGSSSGQGQRPGDPGWNGNEQDAPASAATGSGYQTGQVDLRA